MASARQDTRVARSDQVPRWHIFAAPRALIFFFFCFLLGAVKALPARLYNYISAEFNARKGCTTHTHTTRAGESCVESPA